MSEEEKEAIYEIEDIRFDERTNRKIEIILNLIDKQQKVIDLMAIQLSDRPLLIFKGNGKLEVLEEPEKVVEYYFKKAEEENDRDN